MSIQVASLNAIYEEKGSTWLKTIVEPKNANSIIISELTVVELVSLITRLRRERKVSAFVAAFLRVEFLQHSQSEYIVLPSQDRVMRLARQLVVKHSGYYLRVLDAIQLATAIHARSLARREMTFITSDTRLNLAAAHEGFTVDDPSLHP